MTRVAVMQPYFFPYAGYFRLFARTDVFVLYDCVQFPRRGYVHRNRLPTREGRLEWLTLPLEGAPRETRIDALTFADGAEAELPRRMARFPSLAGDHPLVRTAAACHGPVVDYLEATLRATCGELGLTPEIVRSSRLGLDEGLRGQDRVLALAESLGATTYVNAPGGAELYDAGAFSRRGVRLEILPPWRGDHTSVLHRLVTEPPREVADETLRAS